MLKVAIVGCGKIADSHASQIVRIPGCQMVGAFDREPLMARQIAERYPIKKYYGDLNQLLEDAQPDVVHITTPPESHFDIAKLCLLNGASVYVEKPFTLYEDEARTIIALANDRKLKVTVGHDAQFGHAARRMRKLIQDGYLGSEGAVHMEAYYGYGMTKSAYAGAFLGDKNHWVRKLPGKLLHNIISHGIARIAEYLKGESPRVIAHGFSSPLLKSLGETELIDEARVIISEDERTTAYFTFSSQMKPSLHQFRIYGNENALILDPDQESLIKLRGARYTSYLETFVPQVQFARDYMGNLSKNVRTFLGRDFHMSAGMKFLIENFYRSITEGTPVPIPYREIILTAGIMDSIFAQLDVTRTRQPQEKMALQGAMLE